MEFNLVKVIEPDSLRGRGLAFSGLGPSGLPIATQSRGALLSATHCRAFQLGRRSVDDVVVLREGTHGCYVYVRPDYRYHRRIARLRFGEIPDGFDVDHVHARGLAVQHGFKYVLLTLVPDRINRLHGSYERPPALPRADVPAVVFADRRMLDKILRFNTKVRRNIGSKEYVYEPQKLSGDGLTLKQAGLWNIAFGVWQPPPKAFLDELQPITTS